MIQVFYCFEVWIYYYGILILDMFISFLVDILKEWKSYRSHLVAYFFSEHRCRFSFLYTLVFSSELHVSIRRN